MGRTNLQALLDRLHDEYEIEYSKASKSIYLLWKNKEIEMLEANLPTTFSGYLFSSRALWFWVSNILILASLMVVLVPTKTLSYLRYILGSIFVLFITGYNLIEALYPRGNDLEAITRLTLSIVSSMAMITVTGFILNYTPFAIRLEPIMITMALLTWGLAIFAISRKYKIYVTTDLNQFKQQ